MELARRKFLRLTAAAAVVPILPRFARAQAYPSKPVHLIVAYAAGGSNDILARLMGQWLSERLGQPFVIENRPGGGTNIATEATVRAAPDGYTLLLADTASAINATLYDKLNFSVIHDITPVAGIMRQPYVMLMHPSVPATTVPEFIAYAKAHPGKINMASGGTGSGPHMSGELFKLMAGVRLTYVPYRGGAQAMTDLIGGQVQLFFPGLATSMDYIRTGTLRALALSLATRFEALPDLPTIGEFVPGYEFSGWYGFGRAQEHAHGDRQQAQSGDQCRARRSRVEGPACRSGRHVASRPGR